MQSEASPTLKKSSTVTLTQHDESKQLSASSGVFSGSANSALLPLGGKHPLAYNDWAESKILYCESLDDIREVRGQLISKIKPLYNKHGIRT